MTIFMIKIIACLSMFLDHFKYAVGESNFITQYLGRLAFPLFMFVMVEGYCHTRDVKKYITRLGIAALISQIPYHIFIHEFVGAEGLRINVIATIMMTMICFVIWDKSFSKAYSAILISVIGMLIQILNFEYGIYGMLLGMIFYLLRDKKILRAVVFGVTVAIYYFTKFYQFTPTYFTYLICTLLVLIPIGLYNGKKGRSLKYFFYAFYPVHMILLMLMNYYFI